MTARATDPQTSHDAAIHVASKLPTLKAAFIRALSEIGPATANEIARHATKAGVSANAESVRKRATELVNAGLVRWSGVKVCSVTGERARTVELTNANQLERPCEPKANAEADRQASSGNHGQRPTTRTASQSLRREQVDNLQNQEADAVQARINAVAEFMRHEHQWELIPVIAQQIATLSTRGAWPPGTRDEYIAAVEKAASQGLIERKTSDVRAIKKVAEQAKEVQQELF